MSSIRKAPCTATVRANCNRNVTRETPTHEYATIATWSGAD